MINNFSLLNIYENPKSYSRLSSQMLYGEKFKIIKKRGAWLKIKTDYDKYSGYIKKKNFIKTFVPTLKISSKKTRIFIKKNQKLIKTNKFLYFASRIEKINENKNLIEFEKNKWIKKKDLKKIDYFERNYNKIFKLFLNTKYLWGGKTSDGIDCSSLIQIYFFYNRIFFPRDTKDQLKYCKKITIKKNLKKNIIFWRGHVAYCLDKKKLIHAYGPKKKVVIMNIKKTINKIYKDTKLKPIYI